jgi:EAL domain-containing protein (putative c-di-GMP-specific phosphodiesterase class I)/FixJ family two-component response regulator
MLNTIANERLTILVDDDQFILKMVTKQLNMAGVSNIQTFDDPTAALAKIKQDPYAIGLVITDLQMPQLDGVEFIRQLGNIGFLGSVILISGEDKRVLQSARQLASGYKLQILGYLEKPIQPEALIGLLDGKAATEESRSVALFGRQKDYTAQELKKAIDDYQLVNYYQPKVELKTGQIVGFETLLRWNHPTDGLIAPAKFIELAEHSNLMEDLTRQMMAGPRGALSEARHWHDLGYKVRIAVNISPTSLANNKFPQFVVEQLERARLAPEYLIVEVTESKLAADRLASVAALARLRLQKIDLSIDDFGTGYSSLAQLRDIPFNELKIDIGFVQGASKSKSKATILRACITMAKELGITTVAEGVETREDWDFLASLGCIYGQGYFIAKPMPANEVPAWINRWEVRRRSLTESLFDNKLTTQVLETSAH